MTNETRPGTLNALRRRKRLREAKRLLHEGAECDNGRFTMLCPTCEYRWPLTADSLDIRSCDSGGVYAAYVACPACSYKSDVLTD